MNILKINTIRKNTDWRLLVTDLSTIFGLPTETPVTCEITNIHFQSEIKESN